MSVHGPIRGATASVGRCGYMRAMAEFLRMSNPIQHYAWGSCSVLAEMQGRPGPTEQDPQA